MLNANGPFLPFKLARDAATQPAEAAIGGSGSISAIRIAAKWTNLLFKTTVEMSAFKIPLVSPLRSRQTASSALSCHDEVAGCSFVDFFGSNSMKPFNCYQFVQVSGPKSSDWDGDHAGRQQQAYE